jgi:gliding motility-associated-like protein
MQLPAHFPHLKAMRIMQKLLKFLPALLLIPALSSAQSGCPPLDATPDTAVCTGSLQLNAAPGFSTYSWTPATGLSNPNIPNPVATLSGPVSYTVTGSTSGPNLFVNGDFSLGNVGFSSAYTYTTTYSPCNYYVAPLWYGSMYPSMIDHTPSSDNMYMSVDGCSSPVTLWEQTVTGLSPSTLYDFSFWASRADVVQPDFEIHFIGNVSGDNILSTVAGIPYTGVFTWDQYGVAGWNSTADNSVTVRIINLSTPGYGNDFALDDFDFHTNCVVSDTVNLSMGWPVLPVASDTMLCQFAVPAPLYASGSNLTWYFPDGSSGTAAPVPSTDAAGTYNYYVTQTVSGCVSDSVHIAVQVIAPPYFDLGEDIVRCIDNPVTLGPLNNSWAYSWSDGVTLSPRPADNDGVYLLSAANQCGTYSDSVKVFTEDCGCTFYLPNAFTPNGNHLNDEYKPVYRCDFQSYDMQVFDRWGELIFESEDELKGWNGLYKGHAVEEGVYVVKIRVRSREDIRFQDRTFIEKVSVLH